MSAAPGLTFMDHVGELRRRVIVSVAAIGIGSVVGLIFHGWILDLLASPYLESTGEPLNFFRPTEGFSVVMRLGLFGGVILASPVVIFQVWRFVSPGLTKREKKYLLPLSAVLAVLFVGGAVLGYLSLERGLEFLLGFGGEDLRPLIGGEQYITFATRFILAFAISFEFPVFLFAAAALGLVTSSKLRQWRRWTVVVILVGAALITPSGDPLTLTLLSVPLYAMYEATILAVRFVLKK